MSSFRKTIMRYEPVFRRSLILIIIYGLCVKIAVKNAVSFIDSDIWWHLRTGQWIIENQTVPFTDLFSTMEGAQWIAYSWIYEILQYFLYKYFGLSGFVIYTLCISLLITYVLFSLLRRISGDITFSFALTALGVLAMGGLFQNRSYLLSVLFFVIEMHVISSALKSYNSRLLLILPPVFIFWANIHIQFVFGLLAYLLITFDFYYNSIKKQDPIEYKRGKKFLISLLGIGFSCFLATLVTPYHFLIYFHLINIAQQSEYYKFIDELKPLQFTGFNEWAFLLIALSSAFAMGWSRIIRPFILILFGVALIISFRSFRDIWFAVILGLMIIGNIISNKGEYQQVNTSKLFVISSIIAIIIITISYYGVSSDAIRKQVATSHPVFAADYIENSSYSGPLYSSFEWGGYLIWRLPNLKVSMDSRAYPYGFERFSRRQNTLMGQRNWCNDPDLLSAKTIILSPMLPLTSILRMDRRFKLVYEDDVALVFLPGSEISMIEAAACK